MNRLLEVLNKALAENFWDNGLLLKNIKKDLQELRSYLFHTHLNENSQKSPHFLEKSSSSFFKEPSENLLNEIYLSVYSTDGMSLKQWELILKSLRNLLVHRPIYKNRNDIEAVINSKKDKQNQAYIILYVPQEACTLAESLKDMQGNPLLRLKMQYLSEVKIHRFIHMQHSYMWMKENLILEK